MALGADALTTVAVLLDEVAAAANATTTARAERYIEAASAFAASVCNRSFARADVVDEQHRGMGTPFIFLRRTPIVTVTEVTIDEAVADASTYRIEAVGGVPQALFRKIGWPSSAAFGTPVDFEPIAGTQGADIAVTYSGGWVTPQQAADGAFSGAPRTLPADLEDAVVQLATSRWRGKGVDVRVRSQGNEASAVTFGGEPVPPEVLAILRRYQRIAHR